MSSEKLSPRQKKIDAIKRRILMFTLQETYTDESEAQKHLSNAVGELEEAKKLLHDEQ